VFVGTALVLLALALAFVLRPWKARHGSFAVAVAPFYGTDPESEREGRVFTALVESELARRLPDDDVEVMGADGVRTVVRTARAARTLARKLDVDALVWGEALAFHGEVEVAARITRRDGTLVEMELADALAAAAPNAIAQRRARAVSVVDKVAEIHRPR
jgi:TolB-like protein